MRTLFANTIFFGDSMTQAIGEYGFLDMTNIVYQRSATIDVLITKIPEVAATPVSYTHLDVYNRQHLRQRQMR